VVIVLVKIIPRTGQKQVIIDLFKSVRGPTSMKPGCTECSIYDKLNNNETVLYLEKWSSIEAMQQHIVSSLYTRVLAAMEFAGEQPEISFYEIAHTRGIEFVEELRTRPPRKN
jgi:quinol monooxygenase YgiN